MIERSNASHHIVAFQEGSYVMVKDEEAKSSFDNKCEVLFQVVRHTVQGAYVLRDITGGI
ncbi:hypothetical protein BGZ76_004095, partial [Entomortierella beljakovae]